MSGGGGSTVERLARLETLLEKVEQLIERHMETSSQDRDKLLAKIDKLEARLTEIEGYKNRAYGVLIAFGIGTAGAGAGIAKAWQSLF